MKVLLILLFMLSTASLLAKESEPVSLDVFLKKIEDKERTLDEKYALIQVSGHLAVQEQISMVKSLLEWVKNEEDLAKQITLYCMLNVHYTRLGQEETGKMYLDSAMLYADKTDNVDALGALYYQLGNYFHDKTDMETAHRHYYKAIKYYEQSETKQVLLSMIYYKLGSEYLAREDTLSIGKIAKKILLIKINEPYKIYYDNIYTFVASYYHMKSWKEPQQKHYIDSALLYLRKSVDIFDKYFASAPNQAGARRMVGQNYFQIADILLDRGETTAALEHLAKGEQYIMEGDNPTMSIYHMTKGKLHLNLGNLEEAEANLLKAEMYHDSVRTGIKNRTSSIIYARLALLYAQKKQFEKAYEYRLKENDLKVKMNEAERYNIVKNLETKYEVEKKDQNILRLTQIAEYEQKLQYLYIGIIILVVFLSFFIIIWYRNKRKIDIARLNIAKMKQQESELEASLGKARLEEKNREYEKLLNETQKRQLQSYLEGLENERIRLAKDLHDGVSNDFVSIQMKIDQGQFDKDSLKNTIRRLHEKVRGISHSLMPPVFNYAMFCDVVEDYCRKQRTIFRGNIDYHISQEEVWNNLSPTVALDVYRIVQEGISNAVKHANADFIRLNFDYGADGVYQFSIEDNGEGFNCSDSSITPLRGIGLRTMHERAINLPGELSVLSEKGRGTTISVSFRLTVVE